VKAVADALGVSRSNLVEQVNRDDGGLPPVPPQPPNDGELLTWIRRITDARGSYGYRRVTALVNRELVTDGKPKANHRRVWPRDARPPAAAPAAYRQETDTHA
jgi:hypothetical protein